MAGALEDVPDSYIGRFIDRLDHVQHCLVKENSDAIVAVRGLVENHDSRIDDLDARVASLQTAFGRIVSRPPTSDASHRGPGSHTRRYRTYVDEFEDFLLRV